MINVGWSWSWLMLKRITFFPFFVQPSPKQISFVRASLNLQFKREIDGVKWMNLIFFITTFILMVNIIKWVESYGDDRECQTNGKSLRRWKISDKENRSWSETCQRKKEIDVYFVAIWNWQHHAIYQKTLKRRTMSPYVYFKLNDWIKCSTIGDRIFAALISNRRKGDESVKSFADCFVVKRRKNANEIGAKKMKLSHCTFLLQNETILQCADVTPAFYCIRNNFHII